MAQVYKTFFFPKSRLAFRRFGVGGTPSFRNKIAEMCCLYRRTGQRVNQPSRGPIVNRPNTTLLELQSRFGDTPLKLRVICPKLSPKRNFGPKRDKPQTTHFGQCTSRTAAWTENIVGANVAVDVGLPTDPTLVFFSNTLASLSLFPRFGPVHWRPPS